MILYNDQLVNREEVRIDLDDRGYQFGDGIYEVVSVYNGETFRLKEHLQRLIYSAEQLGLTLPVSLSTLESNLHQLIQAEHIVNGQVYFQVSRGIAPRQHAFPEGIESILIGYVTQAPRPADSMKTGVSVTVTEDIRWLRCDIKSLNLLGSVMAKQIATEKGAYEAVMHRDGIVTEGSTSNTFIVKDGRLHTHPVNNLILNGITRLDTIECAHQSGIEVVEETFTVDDLKEADEVFLTSTINEIMPIVQIDEKQIGNGLPGKITRVLQEKYVAEVEKMSGQEPLLTKPF